MTILEYFSFIFFTFLQSSQDGRLDLKVATQELKAPRSTIDFVASILESIQFLKRMSSDIVQMTNMPDRSKLTKRLEEPWDGDSTLDGWISQLKSLAFSSPDKKGEEGRSPETMQTPSPAKSDNTTEEPQMMGMRTILSPYPANSSPPQRTASTSYPRPARRRTTPVYIFGQSTPFKKQVRPTDRLVQVSSEDTDESNPSSKSDASNFNTPESLPHPLSPAATIRNARSRVLLLANSPDDDSQAPSNRNTAKKSSTSELSPAAAAAAKTAQATSNLKDYDFRKKRVPYSSGDEVSKRPKKQNG